MVEDDYSFGKPFTGFPNVRLPKYEESEGLERIAYEIRKEFGGKKKLPDVAVRIIGILQSYGHWENPHKKEFWKL